MAYRRFNDLDRAIDDAIAALVPPPKNADVVRSTLIGMMPRRVDGRLAETVTPSDVKMYLGRLLKKSAHLFAWPTYDEESAILSVPYEELQDDDARACWRCASLQRRARLDAEEAARNGNA